MPQIEVPVHGEGRPPPTHRSSGTDHKAAVQQGEGEQEHDPEAVPPVATTQPQLSQVGSTIILDTLLNPDVWAISIDDCEKRIQVSFCLIF